MDRIWKIITLFSILLENGWDRFNVVKNCISYFVVPSWLPSNSLYCEQSIRIEFMTCFLIWTHVCNLWLWVLVISDEFLSSDQWNTKTQEDLCDGIHTIEGLCKIAKYCFQPGKAVHTWNLISGIFPFLWLPGGKQTCLEAQHGKELWVPSKSWRCHPADSWQGFVASSHKENESLNPTTTKTGLCQQTEWTWKRVLCSLILIWHYGPSNT